MKEEYKLGVSIVEFSGCPVESLHGMGDITGGKCFAYVHIVKKTPELKRSLELQI